MKLILIESALDMCKLVWFCAIAFSVSASVHAGWIFGGMK